MTDYDDQDFRFMRLAIREARKGLGKTSPNPCVGAVVVKDGTLIAKGCHRKAGMPHAEVNALAMAGRDAKGATIYVTLEPCNHTGRTPPCTAKILAAGVRRVVTGMDDPNPLVSGGGNAYLADRGVSVTTGLLAEECRQLNRPFIKHVTTGLPWVIMKAGLSVDGRIATRSGHSNWVTCDDSRRYVHRLRDRVDAILVGSGTALADDPSLTARPAGGRGRDPLRVVLDSSLQLSARAKMLQLESEAPTWIFCGPDADVAKREELAAAGAVVKRVAKDPLGGLELTAVLRELGRAEITSLLVEGGGGIHAAFLRQGFYDAASLFIAPIFIGSEGVPVVGELAIDRIDQGKCFRVVRTRRLGCDVMIEGLFGNPY
ncbi:MAG: bifunctional diaminohydroxyphosphoribosylaminopyrimidine deaminase/5-amino-6-(5-phosphoribosylamino)uracil reductase RibD [Desulfobulbales bacterium]|nr:bifunctional diaminohydroxyphosphoribosylaminopyrimidine deaminase/5-amino-6-(5-phosphoribosylamino)uracil reductase RibD [Desulfobulbales bacterium]